MMNLNDYMHKNVEPSHAKAIYENDKNTFYVVKSISSRNIQIALERNTWATTPKNEKTFDDAYKRGANVILVFSINGSSQYIGYALMRSRPGHGTVRESIFYLANGNQFNGRQFDILWVRVVDLPFTDCANLNNSCNENLPVKVGRDGQEIDRKTGKELCALFESRLQQKYIPTQEQLYANRYGGLSTNGHGFQAQKAGANVMQQMAGIAGMLTLQQLRSMHCIPPGFYQIPPIPSIANAQKARQGAHTGQPSGTKGASTKRPIGIEHAVMSSDYNPAITIFPVDLTNMSYDQYISLYNISYQHWINRREDVVKQEES